MKFMKGQCYAKDLHAGDLLVSYGLKPTRLIPHVSGDWHPGYPPFVIGDVWFYVKMLTVTGSLHWSSSQRKAICKCKRPIFSVIFTSDYSRHCIQKIGLDRLGRVICKNPTEKELEVLRLSIN